MALNTWTRLQHWTNNEQRLMRLQSNAPEMIAERDLLRGRSAELARHRQLIRETADQRLPAVAPRFLAYLSSIRSEDTHFTEFSTKWDADTGQWSFRLEGQVDGDEQTARETVAALQRTLERSPLRVQMNDAVRSIVMVPPAAPDVPPAHRFAVEGGLFEK